MNINIICNDMHAYICIICGIVFWAIWIFLGYNYNYTIIYFTKYFFYTNISYNLYYFSESYNKLGRTIVCINYEYSVCYCQIQKNSGVYLLLQIIRKMFCV